MGMCRVHVKRKQSLVFEPGTLGLVFVAPMEKCRFPALVFIALQVPCLSRRLLVFVALDCWRVGVIAPIVHYGFLAGDICSTMFSLAS